MTALFLLQAGLGFVFIWTAVLIFGDVAGWASVIEKSWVKKLVPLSPRTTILATAVFDIVVGVWLISGFMVWWAALIAAFHLVAVLLATGIFAPSFRDVGLLATALAILALLGS